MRMGLCVILYARPLSLCSIWYIDLASNKHLFLLLIFCEVVYSGFPPHFKKNTNYAEMKYERHFNREKMSDFLFYTLAEIGQFDYFCKRIQT